MNPLDILILVIIAVASLPFAVPAGYQLFDAFRQRSPDSLRFRERLACGIANAKLAVCQKVAAGWRLAKLLGAIVWLAPRFSVAFLGVAVGYAASWVFGLLVGCLVVGWDAATDQWDAVDRRAMRGFSE